MAAQKFGTSLGEVAYAAYLAETGGKTHDNKKAPEWSKLSDETRNAWNAAGNAVGATVTNNRTGTFPDHNVPPPLPRV